VRAHRKALICRLEQLLEQLDRHRRLQLDAHTLSPNDDDGDTEIV
jgi:hypothetical protein